MLFWKITRNEQQVRFLLIKTFIHLKSKNLVNWFVAIIQYVKGNNVSKHETIIKVSTILNRGIGTEEDTLFFHKCSHEELLSIFAKYLELNENVLGNLKLDITQGLNDRGVDIIAYIGECKVGFQLKSDYDVNQNDFAKDVKRQLTESHAHGLDKWYLLICAPYDASHSNAHKIRHLLNELSNLKIPYHCAFGPLHTVKMFKDILPMEETDFYESFQRYSYGQTDTEKIVKAIEMMASNMENLGRFGREPLKNEITDDTIIKLKLKEAKIKFKDQIRNALSVSFREKSDLSSAKAFEELFPCIRELGNEFLLVHDILKEIDVCSNEAKGFYSFYKSNKEFLNERKRKASAESIKRYENDIKILIQKQEMRRFTTFLNLYEEINSFLQYY